MLVHDGLDAFLWMVVVDDVDAGDLKEVVFLSQSLSCVVVSCSGICRLDDSRPCAKGRGVFRRKGEVDTEVSENLFFICHFPISLSSLKDSRLYEYNVCAGDMQAVFACARAFRVRTRMSRAALELQRSGQHSGYLM